MTPRQFLASTNSAEIVELFAFFSLQDQGSRTPADDGSTRFAEAFGLSE